MIGLIIPLWGGQGLVTVAQVNGMIAVLEVCQDGADGARVETHFVELVQRHPADARLSVIGVRTLRGFVIPADFALKIELQLMCARINIRKFMMCSPLFPHEEKIANAHLRADFFPAFAD